MIITISLALEHRIKDHIYIFWVGGGVLLLDYISNITTRVVSTIIWGQYGVTAIETVSIQK